MAMTIFIASISPIPLSLVTSTGRTKLAMAAVELGPGRGLAV
jgi:hypothetical protein